MKKEQLPIHISNLLRKYSTVKPEYTAEKIVELLEHLDVICPPMREVVIEDIMGRKLKTVRREWESEEK